MVGDFEVLLDLPDLPELLDDNAQLRLYTAEFYDQLGDNARRVWCHYNARYSLPTLELCCFLQDFIGSSKAIEIGAGYGDLSYHLGIPATDSYQQQLEPGTVALYQLTGQPLIRYPKRIEHIDGNAAVAKYKPDIVIASWVTEWIDNTKPMPPHGGNMFGIHEDQLLDECTYVLIGNERVHGKKSIMARPHRTLELPFIRSRAMVQELNRVWVWER